MTDCIDRSSYDVDSLLADKLQAATLSAAADNQQPTPARPRLILDVSYGWPAEKKPRKERINAVANQLHVFILARANTPFCQIVVLASQEADLEPLRKRFCELRKQEREERMRKAAPAAAESEVGTTAPSANGGKGCSRGKNKKGKPLEKKAAPPAVVLVEPTAEELLGPVIFAVGEIATYCRLGGGKQQTECSEGTTSQKVEDEEEDDMDDCYYLSPDSPHYLSAKAPPPQTLIIGGIVDRNVAINRSLKHALKGGLKETRIVKLELERCNLEGLEGEEPLNIDNVMEICDAWHSLYFDAMNDGGGGAELEKGEDQEGAETSMSSRSFDRAATEGMMAHQERHPMRTLHDSIVK
jgi:hypothetical protein